MKFVDGWRESRLLEAETHALAAEMAADAAMEIIDDRRIRRPRMGLLQEFLNFHAVGFGHGSLLRHDAGRLRNGNDEQGVEAGFCFEAIVPAAEFGERADTKLRHVAANFFGERTEIGDDHFRLAVEAKAQSFVLRGDADGAGIEMALASHHTADGDEGRGAEAEFVGAENGSNQNVAREAEAAVHAE